MQDSSCLPSDRVSLSNNGMVFNVSAHRIASSDFDDMQNGRIDEIEISTNLPAISLLFYVEIFLFFFCWKMLFIARYYLFLRHTALNLLISCSWEN